MEVGVTQAVLLPAEQQAQGLEWGQLWNWAQVFKMDTRIVFIFRATGKRNVSSLQAVAQALETEQGLESRGERLASSSASRF